MYKVSLGTRPESARCLPRGAVVLSPHLSDGRREVRRFGGLGQHGGCVPGPLRSVWCFRLIERHCGPSRPDLRAAR